MAVPGINLEQVSVPKSSSTYCLMHSLDENGRMQIEVAFSGDRMYSTGRKIPAPLDEIFKGGSQQTQTHSSECSCVALIAAPQTGRHSIPHNSKYCPVIMFL